MRIPSSGLRIDSPAFPLLQAIISYWGETDNNGNVGGTTIRCGGLALEPTYNNHALKILDGGAAGQVRDITVHPAGTDTVTVANAFTNVTGAAQQILAGTRFVILSKTPAIAEVAALTALVVTLMADVVTLLGVSTEATYSHPNGVAENIAFTIPAAQQRVFIMLDLSNLTQNADIRIKYDIHGDGAPFPTMETFNWTVGMDDIVYFREISGQRAVQVTVQSTLAEGAARDIDYEYILG